MPPKGKYRKQVYDEGIKQAVEKASLLGITKDNLGFVLNILWILARDSVKTTGKVALTATKEVAKFGRDFTIQNPMTTLLGAFIFSIFWFPKETITLVPKFFGWFANSDEFNELKKEIIKELNISKALVLYDPNEQSSKPPSFLNDNLESASNSLVKGGLNAMSDWMQEMLVASQQYAIYGAKIFFSAVASLYISYQIAKNAPTVATAIKEKIEKVIFKKEPIEDIGLNFDFAKPRDTDDKKTATTTTGPGPREPENKHLDIEDIGLNFDFAKK